MRLQTKQLPKGLFNIAVILMVICMLFTGCGQNVEPQLDNEDTVANGDIIPNESATEKKEETNINSGLESGFNLSESARPAGISNHSAYKSEKMEFDIDNVTLEFFFGGHYASGIDLELECGRNYPEFDIYFLNDNGDKVHIKHVEENLVSEKYRCYYVYGEGWHVDEVKYNHSELFTIPKELFTKEKGRVFFEIYGINPNDPKLEYRGITGVGIYYKLTGDKVILSSEKFD